MLVLALAAAVTAQDCSFTLPGGEVVNLSTLRKSSPPDYEVLGKDGYYYKGNICGPLNSACEGDSNGIAAQWTSYSTCIAILGRMKNFWGTTLAPTVGYLDAADPNKGFTVTFPGGDSCFNSLGYVDRTVTYNFYCGTGKLSFDNAYESTTRCAYFFDFYTKLGCLNPPLAEASASEVVPGASDGLSCGWKFLILLFVCVVAYCGLGMAYYKYTGYGSLVESIPQKEFWMEIPSLAADGVSYSLSVLKSGVEAAKSKMTGQGHIGLGRVDQAVGPVV
jgi:hypothetical protein